VATGLQSRLYRRLLPDYASQLGGDVSAYSPPAAKMRALANGYAVPFTYSPSGPLLEYQPAEAGRPPSTPDELLAWARDHPAASRTRVRRTRDRAGRC
jgi:putative spermidine/putrescine transport system substrate-binding protein